MTTMHRRKQRAGKLTKRDLWNAHVLYGATQDDKARLQQAVDDLGIKEPKARTPRQNGKPSVPSEHQEQVAFVRWFELRYPGVLIFAVPNGGARDLITGAMLKAEGVKQSVPDLCIPAMRAWIEMKRRNGVKPADQEAMHEYLRGCGYKAAFARGCDEAIALINEWTKQEA
ncbi:MAG TPA: hypothetical protein VF077_13440 [Nitrospiraceae bacterium]